MMCEFRKRVMSPKFLIKTGYPMKLKMALKAIGQAPPAEATADVIAILKKVGEQPRKIGLLIVESYKTLENEAGSKAAEAQLFAEAVAVAQQPDWDLNDPVYMLRSWYLGHMKMRMILGLI